MSTTPPSFRWPLAVSPWTIPDKLAIAAWIVAQDRFTMGTKVAELEARFSQFAGAHALMVANGSVANQLVFELWKVRHPGIVPVVICPAVTWISSISPALMAGMEIALCDVNLTDFSLDYDMAERLVENHRAKGRHVILWPTALIGFAPDMQRLDRIARRHGADLFLDSCENAFSRVSVYGPYITHPATLHEPARGTMGVLNQSILASADMTTTSGYVSHQWSTVEGGMVFFRHRADYDQGRLFRNHGLARSLAADHPTRLAVQAANPTVDPQFLFALAGTNMRPTDVHAMFGLRDFARIPQSIAHRNALYRAFHDRLDRHSYYLPPLSDSHVGFCLPVFTRDASRVPAVKAALGAAGIETRPIIGGCLPLQPPFHAYGPASRYPNALWVHEHGVYTGLHGGVTVAMVEELCDLLNGLAQAKAA